MNRLACFLSVVCSLSLSISARAQSAEKGGATAEAAEREVRPGRSSDGARATLLKPVDAVDWQEKPFEEVLEWLKKQGDNKVNVVPRWNALQIESVARETPVTLQLNNTIVADVLNECILQLNEDGVIRYRATGNNITISTKADFDKQMYVRVYNVTDLIMRIPDFGREAPQIDLNQAGQNRGGQGGGGGGQSVFGGGGGGGQQNEEEEQGGMAGEMELERRVGNVRNLIISVIEPDSWEDTITNTGSAFTAATQAAGGGKGRIRAYRDSIVVYNTVEVHEAIAGYFSLAE